MAIQKNITIDGIEVPFKASAAVPRLYRLKFRRDIYKDFASLKTEVTEGDENKSEIGIESLEVFENMASQNILCKSKIIQSNKGL